MNKKDYSQLFFDLILTEEDLISLLNQIETAKKIIFVNEQGISFAERLSQAVSENFRKKIADLEAQGILKDVTSQREFFSKLEKELRSIPVLKITLAFDPSREFLTRVADWLMKETKRKILLDVAISDGVLGGAIIEYDGEYRDYSIRKKLNEVLEINT